MSVLVITNDPWDEYSGWKNQTVSLISFLTEENFKVLTYNSESTSKPEVISIGSGFSHSDKIWVTLKYLWFILFKASSFSVLYFPKAHLTILPLIPLARLLGKKCITRISGAELNGTGIKQQVKFLFLKFSSCCVALNNQILSLLTEKGINSKYIPNAINTTRFSSKDRSTNYHSINICTFGSFSRRKGTLVAIKAFIELRQHDIDAKLHMIGPYKNYIELDTDYVQKCMNAIENSTFRNSFILHGMSQNPESILNNCDILLFPSLGEGMPNALIEAMACGNIPIASNIPGVKEIIEDQIDGFLVQDNEDPTPFFNLLVKVIKSGKVDDYRGKAVEKIITQFEQSKVYNQYQKLFSV